MEYHRPKRTRESDVMSLSSQRDGSLTSDLDDLTVVADFDNVSEYDDRASVYRLSSNYEVIGCLPGDSGPQKTPKTSHDINLQTDDNVWKKHYDYNKNKKPTNNKTTQIISRDSPSNINSNNNNSNNIMNSRDSTLREVLDNNEGYDTDDFDGVVETNMNLNGSKSPPTMDDIFFPYKIDHRPQKPKSNVKSQTEFEINSIRKPTYRETTSTGTDPIFFTDPHVHSKPTSNPQPSSTKNPTSFYVPLYNEDGFYGEGHPLDRINLKNTSKQNLLKDKATNTKPIGDFMKEFEPVRKEISKEIAKELKEKSTMTKPQERPAMFNVATFADLLPLHPHPLPPILPSPPPHYNQATNTDSISKIDFQIQKNDDTDGEVYKQMDELMKETEDLYAQLENEVENKKKKERQYEELMGEHERCLGDMKNLKRDLELLKEKAEKAKAVDSLKKLMNRPTQTQELARADAWVQENLIEEAEMLNDLELLQEEVQRLENELEKKQKDSESLASNLDQKQLEIDELAELNDSLARKLEEHTARKTKDNEELGRMKEVVSSMENNALQSNQKLQKVLEDTLADLSAAQHKLKKTDQQLLEKEAALKSSEAEVAEFVKREGGLDKIIVNLKNEINNLNEKISVASRNIEEMDDPNNHHFEYEGVLMEEMNRLVKVNEELRGALLEGSNDNQSNEELARKYNNLRDISSRLQTAVAPLKAKISLANRKLNDKNTLLKALLRSHEKLGTKPPAELMKVVEESMAEQPRPLSPLTIDHVNRLEHDMVNHLRDSFSGLPYDDRKSRSTNDLLSSLEKERDSPYNRASSRQATSHKDDDKKSNFKLLSLFDQPDHNLFEAKTNYTKSSRASKLRSPISYSLNRNPVLIDTTSSYNNKAPLDSHLLLTKSLKTDVLGNKKPAYTGASMTSFNSSRPSARNLSRDRPSSRSAFTPYNELSPPRDFQIDKMEGRRRLLFCWEPPIEASLNSPLVGYELYIDGRKHAQIKPKSERQYRLDLPPATTLPTTFALHSLSSNGHLSVPSQIILHGIHKSAAASDAVKIGVGKLKLKGSPSQPASKTQTSNLPKKIFVAFFDFKSRGQQLEMEGCTYKEVSFRTGDLIETFGDVMQNGYVLGKIKGTSEKGLVPAIFLESPSNLP